MSQEFINPSDGVIRQYLTASKTLAVVGLSDREETTSNRVTKEMQARGYKIIPVTWIDKFLTHKNPPFHQYSTF